MKKALLSIALIIAFAQLKASHLSSDLKLRLHDQAFFTVAVDHDFYNTPSNHFVIQNLEPGRHFLRVTRMNPGAYGPYSFPMVVFNGFIDIPAASDIHAMIDRYKRFHINKIIPFAPEPVCAAPVYNAPPPACYGMNDYEFDMLKRTIDQRSFDSSRLQIAKQAISSNRITAQQVTELLGLMTFESTKLELAKFAYHHTLDKQNYFLVNDAFTFESSIDELNEYIFRG